MTGEVLSASVYAVLQGVRTRYGQRDDITGLRPINQVRVVRVVQNYPTRVAADEIVVRLTLAVPAHVFDPLVPNALITIPEDLIARGPIEIVAVDPNQDSEVTA